MDVVGIQSETQESVFRAVAAVLHLGNITFDAVDDDEAKVSADGEEALCNAARLLGVSVDGLRSILTTRTRRTVDGPIVSPINIDSAINTRDSFAKTLYSRTFDWLVECINKSIGQDQAPVSVIGVLDIYGFEEFARNDFEQFCINFANEKLQQHFNQHVFKMEQKEYEDEGIEWSYIEFVDNQDVLDIIEGTGSNRTKQPGVLDLLDESCKFPRSDHRDFAQKLYSSDFISNSSRFTKPKLSQEDFIIEHYAGPVKYSTLNFLEKNKDFIVLEHQELLGNSTEAFVQDLYPVEKDTSAPQSSFKFSSVSSRFSRQLCDLMVSLQQMEPHYIRCIKPNKSSVPMEFENPSVLQQLRCGGVLEAVRISCAGYPSKRTYEEFYNHFWMMCLDGGIMDEKDITKHIIQRYLPQNDTQYGKTRVFLRAGRMAELEKKRMELQNYSATLIQAHVKSWLSRKVYEKTVSSILRIQTSWRCCLARKELNRRISENAALRIQTTFRRFSARKHFVRTIQAIQLIQRTYRSYIQAKIQHEKSRISAAILIQASWKSYVARREFGHFIKVVIQAQSIWRAKLAKSKVNELKIAARESGKLMQDKENLERRIEKLQSVSDTLKNQRNDLRNQLKVEKASRFEIESGLKAELDGAMKQIVLMESRIEELNQKIIHDEQNHNSALSMALSRYEQDKSSLLKEQEKDKKIISDQEVKLKELEQKMVESEQTYLEKLSVMQEEVHKLALQRDKAREEAQIANGLHGSSMATPQSGHLVMSRSRTTTDEKDGHSREQISDIDRRQREVLAKQQQLLREQRVADQEHLIDALKFDLGFQDGKPVAAVIVFRSFVHWKAIQQEKGTIFDRVSEAIGLQIEAYHDDNDRLGYWLTNTAALYYLMQRHTKPAGTAGENGITARLRFSGQQAAKGFLSYFGRSPGKSSVSDSVTPREGQDTLVQYEARYPALLFKQGLGALVQTIFPGLRDNIKREISSYLSVCMNITGSHGGRALRRGSRNEHEHENDLLVPWKEILRILNELLIILRENHVPHILASKLLEQLFTIINVNLFNQLMLKRDCCSFSNGEYVKMGLAEVEHWIVSTGTDWVGSSWENLSHLRQAVTFLVIHQKARKTLDEIRNDLCPSLSVQQIYRLSTMYWDDRFGTESVSHEVLSQLKVMMTSEGQHAQNHSFLLDEDSAIPFSTDELGTTYDGMGLLDSLVEIPLELRDEDRKDRFSFLTRSLSATSPMKMQNLSS